MLIRPAIPADLPAVAAIYAHEVQTGTATFDLEARPLDAWVTRRAAHQPRQLRTKLDPVARPVRRRSRQPSSGPRRSC